MLLASLLIRILDFLNLQQVYKQGSVAKVLTIKQIQPIINQNTDFKAGDMMCGKREQWWYKFNLPSTLNNACLITRTNYCKKI